MVVVSFLSGAICDFCLGVGGESDIADFTKGNLYRQRIRDNNGSLSEKQKEMLADLGVFEDDEQEES